MNMIWAGNGEPSKRRAWPFSLNVAPSNSPTPRILIVEDELFVAWHLEAIVHDLQFEVSGIVSNGEEAIEKASEADVILMDVNLGSRMDGVEAARWIRRKRQGAIVFVTAYGDEKTIERIKAAVPGAPIVVKPVAPETLRSAILSALKKPE
jgi:CheY-like chemotaxis protein